MSLSFLSFCSFLFSTCSSALFLSFLSLTHTLTLPISLASSKARINKKNQKNNEDWHAHFRALVKSEVKRSKVSQPSECSLQKKLMRKTHTHPNGGNTRPKKWGKQKTQKDYKNVELSSFRIEYGTKFFLYWSGCLIRCLVRLCVPQHFLRKKRKYLWWTAGMRTSTY